MAKTATERTKKRMTKNGEYLVKVFSLLKKREGLVLSDSKTHFNDTEIRLLSEVLAAKYEGRRLISTQLALLLGVTRSAVSQIVNRLESERVVRRVPDDVDRKIAYVEITEEALAHYQSDIKLCGDFISSLVKNFGEEKFELMCELFNEFMDCVEVEKQARSVNK